MEMETDAPIGRTTAGSSETSSEGGQINQQRPVRPSTPEFPYRPSPDVPPWLSKCLRLLTLNSEEAQSELGRMIEEALEKRERQAQDDAALGSKKLDGRPAVSAPKIAPIQAKLPGAAVKAKPLPEKSRVQLASPVKRHRSPSPPLVRLNDTDYTGTTVTIPDTVQSGGIFSGISGPDDTAQLLSDLFPEDSNDPTCVRCGRAQNIEGNKLLKCETCHESYHQLCHKPPVTDVDANDPRLVWYCSTCGKKSAKPVESAALSVNFSARNAAVAKLKAGSSKNAPPVAAAAAPTPSLFQRNMDAKPSMSSLPGASAGGVGLAGLAKLKTQGPPVAPKNDKPPPKRAKYIDSTKINPTLPKNA